MINVVITLLLGCLLALSPKGFADDEFKQRYAELMTCGKSLGLQDQNGVIVAIHTLTKSVHPYFHYGVLNGNPSIHMCHTLDATKMTTKATDYPNTAVSNPNPQSHHLLCNLQNDMGALDSLRFKIGKHLEYLQTINKNKANSALNAIQVCRDIPGLEKAFVAANNSLRTILGMPPEPTKARVRK